MSSALKISDENQFPNISKAGLNNNNHIHTLKSKENLRKTKCSKALKKKLKKYKLRKDGREDPDIINVSKVLVSSLKIKSPDYRETTDSKCIDQGRVLTPRNYLFKMVRHKKSCLKIDIDNDNDSKTTVDNTEISISKVMKNSDTKQMNAFKLMMDSRNKSIGSNSPGKEKVQDEYELNEINKKKELKAKRILSLEKMAQEKGSIKNKEIEEFREESVKTKMLKRAERFKQMIESNGNSKSQKKAHKVSQRNNSENSNDSDSEKSPVIQKGTLKLFNFLSESEPCLSNARNSKNVTKEEREFLNKLSPSIRKKENMLSYFKKVSKEVEDEVDEGCDSIIKVKLTPKTKKKNKQSKAKKPKVIEVNNCISIDSDTFKPGKKRKREENHSDIVLIKKEEPLIEPNMNGRPKRNAKKPTKYSNDILLTSSDEELHIFTPKKKKIIRKNSETSAIVIKIDEPCNDNDLNDKKKTIVIDSNLISKHRPKKGNKILTSKKENNKNIKLAPIFVAKASQNPVDLEAKQRFLKSGVPETLKRKTQQSNTILPTNLFLKVVHIQQILKCDFNKVKDWFEYIESDVASILDDSINLNLFEKLITPVQSLNLKMPHSKQKPDNLLKLLKTRYPKFPVYRTYKLLRSKSQGESIECNIPELDNSIEIINNLNDMSSEHPEKLSWNDKFRATMSKQIIGNFESIRELKKWLESWTENINKNKINHQNESDLSDFCFSDTDTDSKDNFKHSNNILVITGQVGTGKTSSVYAVASELAIKVIEVNASSKRTGKIMLQDLQEATQSHKVNRGPNKIDSSQKSQDEPNLSQKDKKRGRPKKTYERKHKKTIESSQKSQTIENNVLSQQLDKCSQESSRTVMSLILIDDADIIFEQDDGFCSAVSQLIQSSKRPVILITSSLTCPHLQKFFMYGKIIHMQPLLPRMLGTWLDIMCLADTSFCYPGLGYKTLNYYKGDIRKTINFLQYYMTSDKYLYQVEDQPSQDSNIGIIDDENSSMSWASDANTEDRLNTNLTENVVNQPLVHHFDVSINLFNIWWNMSDEFDNSSKLVKYEHNQAIDARGIAKTLDYISYVDALNTKKHKLEVNLTSSPWQSTEVASVFENESFYCYNKSEEVIRDLSNEIIIKAVSTQRLSNMDSPTMSEQRARDKVVSRHKILTTHLHPTSSLDRKALALDYWPFCRTICRLEKSKNDINLKRNNRFCHYMKSVNVLCKNDFFDSLSESMS